LLKNPNALCTEALQKKAALHSNNVHVKNAKQGYKTELLNKRDKYKKYILLNRIFTNRIEWRCNGYDVEVSHEFMSFTPRLLFSCNS